MWNYFDVWLKSSKKGIALQGRAPLAGYKLVKDKKKSLTSVAARNFMYQC